MASREQRESMARQGMEAFNAGDLAGARADVLLVPPGRGTAPVVVLADVLVVSAQSSSGTAVATLRLPVAAVSQVVAAEGRGSLRLVVRASAGVP
jgi:hypothetical protein